MVWLLYWLSRWPWLIAALSLFVFGTLLPPFAWYVRTPLVIGGVIFVWIVMSVIRQGVRGRLFEQAIIDGKVTFDRDANQWKNQ